MKKSLQIVLCALMVIPGITLGTDANSHVQVARAQALAVGALGPEAAIIESCTVDVAPLSSADPRRTTIVVQDIIPICVGAPAGFVPTLPPATLEQPRWSHESR